MYSAKINIGSEPEVVNMKSFDFAEVAKEIECKWVQPVDVYVDGKHYVVLCDEEGKKKDHFTYTGFRGGRNPLSGRVEVDAFVNSFLVCKIRKYKGEMIYTGLNETDMEILSDRIMMVSDPNRGQYGDQLFMNFTSLCNEDLAKEM